LLFRYCAQGIKTSYQQVFIRGFIQLGVAGYLVWAEEKRPRTPLFGPSWFVCFMLCLRGVSGFFSLSLQLLTMEHLPIGDGSVLTMMSPTFAAIFASIFLGEPYRFVEFVATCLSLSGATLVSKPSIIFGAEHGANLSSWGIAFGFSAAAVGGLSFLLVRVLGTSAKMPAGHVVCVQVF
jgi:drug/metabolite transporter (DMT)-like permease